jgi:hypothetical protein
MGTIDQEYLMDVTNVGFEGHFSNCSIGSCLKSRDIRVEPPFMKADLSYQGLSPLIGVRVASRQPSRRVGGHRGGGDYAQPA